MSDLPNRDEVAGGLVAIEEVWDMFGMEDEISRALVAAGAVGRHFLSGRLREITDDPPTVKIRAFAGPNGRSGHQSSPTPR